jgi:thiol:disulfide interchange protein
MRPIRSLLSALSLGLLAVTALASDRTVVTTERVRAELLAHAPEGVGPGKPLWLGLRLTHQPQWHTYWKNPGDSGLATTLAWTLPEGLRAGEIQWPVARKIPIGHLANYGYEGTVLLPVPVVVSPDFKAGPFASQIQIKLKAQWLACKTECIPEEGEFELGLPLRGSTALYTAAFQAAAEAAPKPLPAGGGARVEGQTLRLEVDGLPAASRGRPLELLIEAPGVIETAARWTQVWRGERWTAEVALSAQRSDSPQTLAVVLADGAKGWRAELPVTGNWPAVAVPAGVSPALAEALQRNAGGTGPPTGTPASMLSLAAALLGALLGGLVLNLMPCVFPVLAVKMVGFAQHAQDPRTRHLAGLAYGAGVVASFVALGGLMLALRAGGEQLGWGFQLQSPAVVAGLALLFTLIALNLAGVFEVGSLLPAGLGGLRLRHPVADAAWSGVLAVAIASPCTAPFMGASLGLAIALPAWQALAVFAALGVGMALPYGLLSAWPGLGRWLPRPGAWMDVFRRLMAFPMLATVVWLVWVLGQQSGIHGAAALLALLVATALMAWALSLQGRARLALAWIAGALLAGTAWTLGPWITRITPQTAASGATAEDPSGWQAWSPARVEQALAQGRPVFVDFTAAWCVTCQYNKATTLADPVLLADLQAQRVLLLRADWTRRDASITAALNALGRSGVPVYVVHKPGQPPVVLPEILAPADVRAALGL